MSHIVLVMTIAIMCKRGQDCYLVFILNEMAGNTIMVFTRTCESTRRLALILRNLGMDAIPISGQMSQVLLHSCKGRMLPGLL